MAKFALIGYGSDGRGVGRTEQGYTYVVNDNVRTGDTIQPIATSSKGRKFATTGVANHAYKETSAKGQNAKIDVLSKGDKEITKGIERNLAKGKISMQQVESEQQRRNREVTEAFTGKQLGLTRKGQTIPEYQQQTRAGNIAMQLKKDPNTELTAKARQTFNEYSKQFMNKENR